MFVLVTAVAVWLGWELRLVRERQRLWLLINKAGGYTLTDSSVADVSLIRSLLGDRPRQIIAIPAEGFNEAETSYIQKTFPESIVPRSPASELYRQGDEDTI